MRVLIVEDQSIVRDLLTKVCRAYLTAAQVVAADCVAQARSMLLKYRCTLMILDIHLPDGDGFDFAKEARQMTSNLKIIGISADCSEYTVSRIFSSPLHAFLDKSSQSAADLLQALQVVTVGKRYYSPAVTAVLRRLEAAPDSFIKILSRQETAILCKVGLGWSNAQIGTELRIAPATVKWHCKELLHRLGLKDHAELIVYANRKGFANLSSIMTVPNSPADHRSRSGGW
ncbi:MAG: response regulator transcription factor [Opitutaceae bacterium]|nr:response regulator transcription factor [Opitutaceae bacterium]